MNKLEYIGKIDVVYSEEGGVRIGEHNLREIADCVQSYMSRYKLIHISYFISNIEMTKAEFLKNNLIKLSGSCEIESYDVCGSELTGYMWTDQKFKIGEHDLLSELTTHDGKYCYLKIYNAIENRECAIDDVLKK